MENKNKKKCDESPTFLETRKELYSKHAFAPKGKLNPISTDIFMMLCCDKGSTD